VSTRCITRRRTHPYLFSAVLVSLAVALAGCGNSGSGSSSAASSLAASSGAFPVTVTAANGSVALSAQPRRIVSLSPTATEMLYAVDAGSQVVAVDGYSNFPTQAPTTKLSSLQPNVEAIAGYRPDLVVASNDAAGMIAALGKVKIPVLLLPAATSLDAAYGQVTVLGTATGHTDKAASVVAETRRRVDAAVASVPKSKKPVTVYHELDPTYYSATSATFVGAVYTRFGLRNVADAAARSGAVKDYPQLSSEFVVSSAPDMVVLADTKCCKQTVATVSARPGWKRIPAVSSGAVVEVDDDTASRWGPRVAEFAEKIAAALKRRIG
jgi:ABC-type Fe3+-hydroxamate transport system substrate-binding protein